MPDILDEHIVITDPINYSNIAASIRRKNGESTLYKPSEMSAAIDALNVSGVINLQNKTVNPTTSSQQVSADSGYDGLDTVTVTAIQTEEKTTSSNGEVTPTSGKYLTKVTVNVPSSVNNQNKTVTPTESRQNIVADSGYTGLGLVTVNAIPAQYIIPTGTLEVTENGTYDVTEYADVDVDVSSGSTINNQNKTVSPTESQQQVTYDSGYTGLGTVTVNAISSTYVGSGIDRRDDTDLTVSGDTITVPSGYYENQASKSISSGGVSPVARKGDVTNNSITVSSYADTTSGFIGTGRYPGTSVTVSASELVSGTLSITSNGTQNVTNYASVNVQVPTGSTINNQDKSVSPTESEQEVTYDSGYTGLGTVTVGAISSTYVGSGITRRDDTDLTASGATVTVPSGYYESQETKSISSGSATAPSSISGTTASVSTGTNTLTLTKSVSVTPVVSAGYISSGTATNSNVSLTASIPINPTTTVNGATVTIPTGYYTKQTTKSVSSGSATGPTSISSSSATVTTGTNTLTLTKTGVSTTPTVSAGYISSATSSTATVALTANVTTKSAQTYTPGTTNQTIASGTYLTGTQTIAGDADLVASNIKAGVSIFNVTGTFTSDATATAADILNGETAYVNGREVEGTLIVNKYYTGSSTPSSSLGNDGDIYLQS